MSVPELPVIDDIDLLFEVLTPKDHRQGTDGHEWNENQRLAELGQQVLNNAVTFHYFSKRPVIRAEEIKTWREHQTSPNTLNGWLDIYQLKNRLRVPSDMRDTIHNDLQQMASFFHSYVGAVYITKGSPVVQTWIAKLIDPEADVGPQTQPGQSATAMPNQNNNASPGPTDTSTGTNTSTSLVVPVSMVNEVAIQRGHAINYVASSEGPSHLPSWTVRCLINNVEKGMGVACTQKIAKEEAARRAWVAMGW